MPVEIVTPESETQKYKITAHQIDFMRREGERNLSDEQLFDIFDSLTSDLHFLSTYYTQERAFYRCREITNERFSKVSEIANKPAKYVLSEGRCNKIHQSVFYGSFNVETALDEISAQSGSTYQVGVFQPRDGYRLLSTLIGISEQLYNLENNPLPFTNSQIYHREFNSNMHYRRSRLFDYFITEHFRKRASRPYHYKITNNFSQRIFNSISQSITYPSVQNDGGWNIAINENTFRHTCRLTSTYTVKVERCIGYGMYDYAVVDHSSHIVGEDIYWIPKNERGTEYIWDFDRFVYEITKLGKTYNFRVELLKSHGHYIANGQQMEKLQVLKETVMPIDDKYGIHKLSRDQYDYISCTLLEDMEDGSFFAKGTQFIFASTGQSVSATKISKQNEKS
ncbi:RES domain-containing protein [Thalassospira povalilytica]|uniref:RES domain-containing protein n=1 Tax=Thalassospira povalilytica TaxID=732237 RepID=A0A8I1M7F0_9PROT|nr:RES domain-containing protein [Thalassospira povalilytica]MBN8196503.1 RES domain-containing protein [Thalassospira povalilytica]